MTALSLKAAALLLNLSPDTLRVQIRNGKLRAQKDGRDWRVAKKEIERYNRENKRKENEKEGSKCKRST